MEAGESNAQKCAENALFDGIFASVFAISNPGLTAEFGGGNG